jgi:hypothetical protein
MRRRERNKCSADSGDWESLLQGTAERTNIVNERNKSI